MFRTTALPGVDGAIGYLRQKFDWVDTHLTDSGSLVAIVGENRDRWRVNLSKDFLRENEAAEIRRMLEEWNLAGEMRRANGLDLTVSSAGIRLDSSN